MLVGCCFFARFLFVYLFRLSSIVFSICLSSVDYENLDFYGGNAVFGDFHGVYSEHAFYDPDFYRFDDFYYDFSSSSSPSVPIIQNSRGRGSKPYHTVRVC